MRWPIAIGSVLLVACHGVLPYFCGSPLETQARDRFIEMPEHPMALKVPIETLGVVELTPGSRTRLELVRCLESLQAKRFLTNFVFLLEGADPENLDNVINSARAEATKRNIGVVLVTASDDVAHRETASAPMSSQSRQGSVIGIYMGAFISVLTGDLYFEEEARSAPWRKGSSTHLLRIEPIRSFCVAVQNRTVELALDRTHSEGSAETDQARGIVISPADAEERRKVVVDPEK